MLLNLPLDVLKLILDMIPHKYDLVNLASATDKSHRGFCDFMNSYLYSELVLPTVACNGVFCPTRHKSAGKPRIIKSDIPESCVPHVRSLKLKTTDVELLCSRELPPESGLLRNLNLLKPETLVSFSSDIPPCLCPGLLGPEGYLNTKQTSLKRLSLKTSRYQDSCSRHSCKIDISAFETLTHLSWERMFFRSEFEALGVALRANSRNLLSLRIGLPAIKPSLRHNGTLAFSLGALLRLKPGEVPHNAPLGFPALQKLSLTWVPLQQNDITGITRVLNFSHLRGFTASNCQGIEKLLRELVNSRSLIRLESLTIEDYEFGAHVPDAEREGSIAAFLRSFTGLKRLYLRLASGVSMNNILRAAVGHCPSLTHLVYHCTDVEEDSFNTHDCSSSPLETEDRILIPPYDEHPFAPFDLEFLALCCNISDLNSVLKPFLMKNTLKVLHIRVADELQTFFVESKEDMVNARDGLHWLRHMDMRASEKMYHEDLNVAAPFRISDRGDDIIEGYFEERFDLHNFANWVFGPAGISSLKLICLSDNPFEDRTSMNAALLCRNERPFETRDNIHRFYRTINVRDIDVWELVDRHSDFLHACPEGKRWG